MQSNGPDLEMALGIAASELQEHKQMGCLAMVLYLDSCAVGNSLIGVDGFAELAAMEEVAEHLLDLGDAGGSANQHYVLDRTLVHLGILHGHTHHYEPVPQPQA